MWLPVVLLATSLVVALLVVTQRPRELTRAQLCPNRLRRCPSFPENIVEGLRVDDARGGRRAGSWGGPVGG